MSSVPSQTAENGQPDAKRRMSAVDRRADIVRRASLVFARSSYSGATTASIAAECGVSEPVLYRHFAGKADLYVACLDAAWTHVRTRWDEELANPDLPARAWYGSLIQVALETLTDEEGDGPLWVRAITEAVDDPSVKPRVAEYVRELHEYVADVIAKAQEQGGLRSDLDPRIEAWTFLAHGMLFVVSRQLEGVADDDFPELVRHRTSAVLKRK